MIIDAEFNIGDTVTYMPYDRAHAAEVKDIRFGMFNDGKCLDGTPDNRIFYKLSGEGVNSICSGRCILESKLYKGMS